MTARKSFKKLVRARMKETGESYSTARMHVIKVNPPCDHDWEIAGMVGSPGVCKKCRSIHGEFS